MRDCGVEVEHYACTDWVFPCANITPPELRLRRKERSKLRPLQEMAPCCLERIGSAPTINQAMNP
jgi:hypothetical protein